MDTPESLRRQAELFASYLIGKRPHDPIIARYQDALEHTKSPLNEQDTKRLEFVLKHAWALKFMDAGLVFADPHSEVRRRLYVMLAILEATPEYTEYFLPQQRSIWYLFTVGYAGAAAVLKAMAGVVLIKVVR